MRFCVKQHQIGMNGFAIHWTNCSFATFVWRKYNATNMPFAYGVRCTLAVFASFVNRFRFRPVVHNIEFENSLQSSLKHVFIRTLFGFWSWFWVDEVEREKRNIYYYTWFNRYASEVFAIEFRAPKKKRVSFGSVERKGIFLLSRFIPCKISALSWLSGSNKRKSNYDIR